MDEILTEYFAALKRIQSGKTRVVPKGTKISNDAVSLEAGRKKGAIKRSRAAFSPLIEAIQEAARGQFAAQRSMESQLAKAKHKAKIYRSLYEESIAREICLLRELEELKSKVQPLKLVK